MRSGSRVESAKHGTRQRVCITHRHGAGHAVSISYLSTALTPYMQLVAMIRSPEDILSSPLGQHILDHEPSHEFVIPTFTMFGGSTDPYDHMLHYNPTMTLNADDDLLLCKVFPASFRGPTLAWFHKLPRSSINKFNKLWGAFISQHLCSMR